MRKIAGYLTKNRNKNNPKSPKAHTKTNTSSQEKLFVEIQTVSKDFEKFIVCCKNFINYIYLPFRKRYSQFFLKTRCRISSFFHCLNFYIKFIYLFSCLTISVYKDNVLFSNSPYKIAFNQSPYVSDSVLHRET